MKKLFSFLAIALLSVCLLTGDAEAVKRWQVIHYPSQTITDDQLLDLADDSHMADLSGIQWDRIVVEVETTAVGSTDFNLEMVTTNDQNFDGSDTLTENILAVKADGSTAMASGNISATGRVAFGTGKYASTGAAASNIGKYLGLFFDDNTTSATLEVWVYVEAD